jgi:hypothetical protein
VAVHCRIKFIVNLWPQSGALGVLLILVAIVLLFAFLLVRRSSGVRKIKNKPLTSISAFNTLESQGHSASSGQPRLTRIGWSVMIMTLAMGIFGAGLMCVTFRKFELDNRFAKEAQTTTAAVLNTSNMRGRVIIRSGTASSSTNFKSTDLLTGAPQMLQAPVPW